MSPLIEVLPSPPPAGDVNALADLLRDAIEGGASVGFMLPVREAEMASFWQAVVADVASRRRIVLVTRDTGRIVGSVQLELAGKPNASHRAELQKLLVLRTHRRNGLGGALMHAAENAAREHGRSLIVLDTSTSGNARSIYARGGYTSAGVIPRYARDPDGPLIDTEFYYKELPPP